MYMTTATMITCNAWRGCIQEEPHSLPHEGLPVKDRATRRSAPMSLRTHPHVHHPTYCLLALRSTVRHCTPRYRCPLHANQPLPRTLPGNHCLIYCVSSVPHSAFPGTANDACMGTMSSCTNMHAATCLHCCHGHTQWGFHVTTSCSVHTAAQ